MEKFLESYNLLGLNHEEMVTHYHQTSQIDQSLVKRIKQSSKMSQKTEVKDQTTSQVNSMPSIQRFLIPLLFKLFQRIEEGETLSSSFYKVVII